MRERAAEPLFPSRGGVARHGHGCILQEREHSIDIGTITKRTEHKFTTSSKGTVIVTHESISDQLVHRLYYSAAAAREKPRTRLIDSQREKKAIL
jgi:hypothetical protein